MKLTLNLNRQYKPINMLTRAICIYFLSIPFDFIPIGSFGSISKAVAFLPLLVIFFNIYKINLSGKKLVPIVGFLLVSFCSSVMSVHSSAIGNWFSLFQNLSIIALMLCFSYNEFEYRAIETSVLLSGVILCVLFFGFNYIGETGRLGISLMGVEQNFNYLCGYLLLPLAICLKRILEQKNKVIFYALALLIIVVVFLSGSRGGLFACAGIIGFYLLMNLNNRRISLLRKIVFVISFALFFVILLVIFEKVLPEELRVRYLVQSIVGDKGSNRMLIWDSMLKSYSNFGSLEKLFGVGVGTSKYYSYNGTYAAHNVFIAYLLECGVVGLAIYVGLLIRLAYLSIKERCFSQFAALVGFVIISMTTTFTNFKPLWVFIFYMIVSINQNKNKGEQL